MKRTILLLPLFFCLNTIAEDTNISTRKVLDETYSQLTQAGGMTVEFTATTIIGKEAQGSTSGTMNMQDKKFCLTSGDAIVWFDGTREWCMRPGDTEATLTEPNAEEKEALNPFAYLQLYKHGYNCKMKKGTLSNGKSGYKVFMNASSKNAEIREAYIEIDHGYNLVRISFRQGKENWMRLNINSIAKGKTFSDSDFIFPESKYPNVEIIDLR